MSSNELSQYYVYTPPTPTPVPPVIQIDLALVSEFICDREYETEVAQLTMSIMTGMKSYYLFPEVINELTEI